MGRHVQRDTVFAQKNKIDQLLGWGKIQPGKKVEVEDKDGKNCLCC